MKNRILALVLVLTLVLALALAGCGKKAEQATEQAGEQAAEEAGEQVEQAAEEAEQAAEEAGEEVEQAVEETVGMANPWEEYDTPEEAAQAAGYENFDIAEMEISLGKVVPTACRAMPGLVEVDVEFPASMITLRKCELAQNGDCSGDYNSYAHKWTQNVKGLKVNCFGNEEGRSTKTIWTVGTMAYSIVATALGGEENFGLSADDINSLINGIQ